MSARKRILIASMLLVLLLPACQSGGGEDIVGRWEFGNLDFGLAYEFYDDGTGAIFRSLDAFDPTASVFTYTYDSESGVLKVSPINESIERTMISIVSFESENEISVEHSGLGETYQYVRKPLPKLPPGARARIGGMMLGKDFLFIDAEKLGSGWEEGFENYKVVARTNIELTVGEDADEWLVTIQIEGEDAPELYVLRKGEGRWGVMQLIKNE